MKAKQVIVKNFRNAEVAIGALAGNTALSLGNPLTEYRARMPSLDFVLTMIGFSGVENTRLVWGIAEATVSVTEIAEFFNASPVTPRDAPLSEQARRPVKVFGGICDPGAGGSSGGISQGHRKVNLSFEDDIGWHFFVYNTSATALTTGGLVTLWIKHYLIAI